jgi:aminocarboxymuconate-semialdehyde decarboxylase
MYETTIAAEPLILAGVLDRHPALTVVIVHSGGYVAYQQGRLRHARTVRPYPPGTPDDPSDYFGQIRFDCLTHDRKSLAFLIDRVGAANVLLGTDLPCDMATPEPWTDLVAAADEATATLIAERNPARLYGLEAPAPATAA